MAFPQRAPATTIKQLPVEHSLDFAMWLQANFDRLVEEANMTNRKHRHQNQPEDPELLDPAPNAYERAMARKTGASVHQLRQEQEQAAVADALPVPAVEPVRLGDLMPSRAQLQSAWDATCARLGRRPCQCGCGHYPKSRQSRFLPGHDSRQHRQSPGGGQ